MTSGSGRRLIVVPCNCARCRLERERQTALAQLALVNLLLAVVVLLAAWRVLS